MNRILTQRRTDAKQLPHLALPALIFGLLSMMLMACGGGPATPTPLPPDVARPVQPTPAYGNSTQFTLATPTVPTAFAISAGATLTQTQLEGESSLPVSVLRTLPTLAPQTPSALGIATGGATLLDQPGGQVLLQLPVGEIVTVTGKTADGRYLAVYTNAGDAGWIATRQLALYGADDLMVVEAAAGPGPIATLLAEAMQPVKVLDALVATPTVPQ
jgi:hypothetical protein